MTRPVVVRHIQPREVAGSGDDLQSPDARGESGRDLLRSLDIRDCVERADGDERRAFDAMELLDHIETAHQVHAALGDGRISNAASELILVRHDRSECGEHPLPFRIAYRIPVVVASGQLGDLIAGDATDAVDQSVEIEPRHRRLEDEAASMSRVSGAVEHRHEPAHRMTEHDRPDDAERIAEGTQVVGAEFEGPVGCVAPGRSPMTAEVEVDDLGDVTQRSEVGLEVRVVVRARPAVDEDDGRSRPHRRAGGHHLEAIDVEPEPRPVDFDLHRPARG